MSCIRITFTAAGREADVELRPEAGPAEAVLLSPRGEPLQRFPLRGGYNQLSFQNHPAGVYQLRVETDAEVAVQQVYL